MIGRCAPYNLLIIVWPCLINLNLLQLLITAFITPLLGIYCTSICFVSLLPECFRAIIQLLMFVSHGQFVNMAHIDPNILIPGNPVKFSVNKSLAIGIMGISVQECYL